MFLDVTVNFYWWWRLILKSFTFILSFLGGPEIKSQQPTTKSEYKRFSRKEGAMILLRNSRICPFKWKKNLFICLYCDEPYADPAKLRAHNNNMHKDLKLAEISCALNEIANNDLVKADITDVSCKLCDTTIDRFNDLKIHLVDKHRQNSYLKIDAGILPFKLDLGFFKCGICDDEFPKYMNLSRHFNKHFQNYICEQCGSGFVSQGRLRTHFSKHSLM